LKHGDKNCGNGYMIMFTCVPVATPATPVAPVQILTDAHLFVMLGVLVLVNALVNIVWVLHDPYRVHDSFTSSRMVGR
jgi:hypothetical protein